MLAICVVGASCVVDGAQPPSRISGRTLGARVRVVAVSVGVFEQQRVADAKGLRADSNASSET